jgi:CheY-like chemotaxis protein
MDIQLPEVSGLEVTRWLKEDPELKAIPVVAVTAFAMKSDEERIRQSRDCPIARGTRASHIDRSVGSAAARVREHTTVPTPRRNSCLLVRSPHRRGRAGCSGSVTEQRPRKPIPALRQSC